MLKEAGAAQQADIDLQNRLLDYELETQYFQGHRVAQLAAAGSVTPAVGPGLTAGAARAAAASAAGRAAAGEGGEGTR